MHSGLLQLPLQLRASQKLLSALLANRPQEVEWLLAREVQLRGSNWPGKFTALHAAAVGNCAAALLALLAAASLERLSIDSQLDCPHIDRFLLSLTLVVSPEVEQHVIDLHSKVETGGLEVVPLELLLAQSYRISV